MLLRSGALDCGVMRKKGPRQVCLSFPLPPPTGNSDDIMDDTQYDVKVKGSLESHEEASGDVDHDSKENVRQSRVSIMRENKSAETEKTEEASRPKPEPRFLFEAPPPYEEDPTQSGGKTRMVAIKMPELPTRKPGDAPKLLRNGRTSRRNGPSSVDSQEMATARQPAPSSMESTHHSLHTPVETSLSTAPEPSASRESKGKNQSKESAGNGNSKGSNEKDGQAKTLKIQRTQSARKPATQRSRNQNSRNQDLSRTQNTEEKPQTQFSTQL
ncbi:hypothetical protein Q1695_008405 [Nippostrongylus brasiliensis]|nr:hypothetical protein Q1695_008405 [Nippostrongylus brasiliensis]